MSFEFTGFSNAADNNKQHILDLLCEIFTDTGAVLEIGSGTGQHAVYFANALSHLQWQPSEQLENLALLQNNISAIAPANVLSPVQLDVSALPWNAGDAKHIFAANVLHIMDARFLPIFFEGASQLAQQHSKICLYGPYKYEGKFTTASNERFDAWLKDRNPVSGIRDFETVRDLAQAQGFDHTHDYPMPANNQLLVFTKS